MSVVQFPQRDPAAARERFTAIVNSMSSDDVLKLAFRVQVSKGTASLETRQSRRARWRKVECRREFYERLRDLLGIADNAAEAGAKEASDFMGNRLWRFHEIHKKACEAEYEMLLTPAPAATDLVWKQKRRKSGCFSEKEAAAVDRQMADDEAWLRANNANRYGRAGRPRKS